MDTTDLNTRELVDQFIQRRMEALMTTQRFSSAFGRQTHRRLLGRAVPALALTLGLLLVLSPVVRAQGGITPECAAAIQFGQTGNWDGAAGDPCAMPAEAPPVSQRTPPPGMGGGGGSP